MSGISVVCRNWNLCFLEKKFKRTIDIIVFARIFSFKLHFFGGRFFGILCKTEMHSSFFFYSSRKEAFIYELSFLLSLALSTDTASVPYKPWQITHTIFGNFSNFHCALKNLSKMYLCTLMHCYKQLKRHCRLRFEKIGGQSISPPKSWLLNLLSWFFGEK